MAPERHIVPRCHSQDTSPTQLTKPSNVQFGLPMLCILQSQCDTLTQLQLRRELMIVLLTTEWGSKSGQDILLPVFTRQNRKYHDYRTFTRPEHP